MRLTVGPLPPAVYWRRRAIVLGAVLLFALVLAYSCAKSDPPTGSPRAAGPTGAPQNPAPSAVVRATPTGATAVRATPTGATAASNAAPPPATAPSAAATESAGEPSAGADAKACTDDEISVVATPAQDTVPPGGSVEITLQIKNASKRTCTRDL
ncbi:MAG TPA: hypothetical protein VHN18_20505, partial [Micromonosporaceae bacterium]|nr:hypothetical protein [Micromonosporaceae bacterium]